MLKMATSVDFLLMISDLPPALFPGQRTDEMTNCSILNTYLFIDQKGLIDFHGSELNTLVQTCQR